MLHDPQLTRCDVLPVIAGLDVDQPHIIGWWDFRTLGRGGICGPWHLQDKVECAWLLRQRKILFAVAYG